MKRIKNILLSAILVVTLICVLGAYDETNFSDDSPIYFGSDLDWSLEYDEAVDNQLIFLTAGTGCTATTDPMYEIIVGATPTANQQVFGVSKGTQASNTALFTLDEDGDAVVTGSTDRSGGDITAVVAVTDAAAYTVLAANSGKVHIIGNLSQNTTITLPAAAAGLNYTFIYVASAAEAHDHVIASPSATNYYSGGVAFIDSDAGAGSDELHAGVYSDGDSNDNLTINNMAIGTKIEVYCNGTVWYLTGLVLSDTVPSIAD